MRTETVYLPAAAWPRPGIVAAMAVGALLLALLAGMVAALVLGGAPADAVPVTELAPFRWGPSGPNSA